MRSARAIVGTALLSAALAIGAGAVTGCYTSYSNCSAYYGYYDYYCGYYWYDYWWYYDYDWYYYRTIPEEIYPNPDPEVAAAAPQASTYVREVVFLQSGGGSERPKQLGETFNEAYPCGLGDHGYTVCDEGSAMIDPEDEHLLLAMRLADVVDHEPGSDTFVIGWAFDSDNDRTNNFVPSVEHPDGYFGDTDLWYAAVWKADEGWKLEVTDWSSGEPEPRATNGRVIFDGDIVALIVPLDDFVAPDPGVRVSMFRQSPADGSWSGFVHPMPGDGLVRPIPR